MSFIVSGPCMSQVCLSVCLSQSIGIENGPCFLEYCMKWHCYGCCGTAGLPHSFSVFDTLIQYWEVNQVL